MWLVGKPSKNVLVVLLWWALQYEPGEVRYPIPFPLKGNTPVHLSAVVNYFLIKRKRLPNKSVNFWFIKQLRSCDERKKHRKTNLSTSLAGRSKNLGFVKNLFFIPTCLAPPWSRLISLVKRLTEVCKMASKPLKDLFEEVGELYDNEFGEDAKL